MVTNILGLLVIAAIVAVALIGLKVDEHYRHLNTKGQQDYIRHVDESERYSGLARWSYQRGRHKQAVIDGEESK